MSQTDFFDTREPVVTKCTRLGGLHVNIEISHRGEQRSVDLIMSGSFRSQADNLPRPGDMVETENGYPTCFRLRRTLSSTATLWLHGYKRGAA